MNKKYVSLSITVLLFIFAVVVFIFMEKNTFNIIVGGLAIVLGVFNVTGRLRKR
ncbi:hypothetical protein [Paenibacillus sp. FSL H3-0286]|uniref:hypothetical protein n=1 Tax=Paenibacillus sp. FSL H3-0286 TaxID=2921427 RepID=UPI003243A2A0